MGGLKRAGGLPVAAHDAMQITANVVIMHAYRMLSVIFLLLSYY